jgi:F-type H+-transporting ATPase subunit b
MTNITLGPRWAVSGAALLLLTDTAVAAEEASSPGLFTGDVGNIIWTLLTFLAVVFVLGKFAWRPILRGLQSREEFIRRSLEDADQANRQARTLLSEYEQKLQEARREASGIIEEGRRDAEIVRKNIHEETRKEADAMIARAKREIGLARDAALRDLYTRSADLATDLAGQILGREVKPADHLRLIEDSIAALTVRDASEN